MERLFNLIQAKDLCVGQRILVCSPAGQVMTQEITHVWVTEGGEVEVGYRYGRTTYHGRNDTFVVAGKP